MAQDVHTITAVDWQPALGALGEIVETFDDVAQCIRIILTTPKGADPHRPEFGCDLWRFVDNPILEAIPHLIREAVDALGRWEKRIQVVRIIPEVRPPSGLHLRVEWRIVGRALSRFTELELR